MTHTRKSTLPLAVAFGALAAISESHAAPPLWWTARGAVNSTLTGADYAVVNLGQLKNFIAKAADELNARFPGGAGTVLNQQVAAWGTPGASTADYAAANLGQVKNLTGLIRDRLATKGYTYIGAPTGGSSIQDYAAANLGQVKYLLDFDLTRDSDIDGFTDEAELAANTIFTDWASHPVDTDGDGITDADEALFGLNPNVNDATLAGSSITYTYDKTRRVLGATGLTTVTVSYDAEGNVQNTAQSQ